MIRRRTGRDRRAATVLMTLVLLAMVVVIAAFAFDLGHMVFARAQLQVAADSASLTAARTMSDSRETMLASAQAEASRCVVEGRAVRLLEEDVEYGTWDLSTRTFVKTDGASNAVRVTARCSSETGGGVTFLLARLFGKESFPVSTSAVAIAVPRDIALVVDLSGSMNDDSEPCWATDEINRDFADDAIEADPARGVPPLGDELVQRIHDDFNLGPFPGAEEHLGEHWGLSENAWAYAELTRDGGPLAKMDQRYRIESGDDEVARKRKAYSAIIDLQIARLMPAAVPSPDSDENYAFWEAYLDYLAEVVTVGPSAEPRVMGTPPTHRGLIPPSLHSAERIDDFNNPNLGIRPEADVERVARFRNRLGYRTYVQFMIDLGRNRQVAPGVHSPLSTHSTLCPEISESTPGGTFSFPPRTQPMHDVRRALIAGLEVLRQHNADGERSRQGDWVSVISFDSIEAGGPVIHKPLGPEYDEAMLACVKLQAVSDKGSTTATESGIIAAGRHVQSVENGGTGRSAVGKVIVLVTDGVPNAHVTPEVEINQFMADNPSDEFHGTGEYWFDAVLMRTMQLRKKGWRVYPVGVGLAANHDFLDRMARLGNTADKSGRSARGLDHPGEYEQRLVEVLEDIINTPTVRLVK